VKVGDFFSMLRQKKGAEILLAAVMIIGALILLLVSPGGTETPKAASADNVEARLEETLSAIEGVGRVQAMLTYTGGRAADPGWLASEAPQGEVVGVIVVAEGGGDVRVQLEVIRAVQTVLGVEANRVEVFAYRKDATG